LEKTSSSKIQKMKNRDKEHRKALDQIVNDLSLIRESRKRKPRVIAIEPRFRDPLTGEDLPSCDLVVDYYDETCLLAEVKHSRKFRQKAYKQLKSSRSFLIDNGVEPNQIRMKFITYGRTKAYQVETVK